MRVDKTSKEVGWACLPATGETYGRGAIWAGAAEEDREVVAEESTATAREDGRATDQTCPLLLAVAGRESFDVTIVRGDGAADCGAAPTSLVDGGTE